MTRTVLSTEQIYQYLRDGYLLVSGLIPPEVAARAEAAMWRCLGIDPNVPESWKSMSPDVRPGSDSDPDLAACYTPEVLVAAAHLGEGNPAADYPAPRRAGALNIFPQEGEWSPHAPHIDHAIKEHGHKTFPYAFRVASMLYLNDVERHSAGTVVWPGSHLKIEALARSNPERYEYMWPLNRDLHLVNLGEVVELTPKRGDVLFYHVFCAHSGSKNAGSRPRFAFNCKW